MSKEQVLEEWCQFAGGDRKQGEMLYNLGISCFNYHNAIMLILWLLLLLVVNYDPRYGPYAPNEMQTWARTHIADPQYRAVMVRSRTGSGKTLAYIPRALQFSLQRKARNNVSDGPSLSVVIIANLLENAMQIRGLINELVKANIHDQDLLNDQQRMNEILNKTSLLIFGGMRDNKGDNIKNIERYCPGILVGTSGRAVDVAETRERPFRRVKLLIFDEAGEALQKSNSATSSTSHSAAASTNRGHNNNHHHHNNKHNAGAEKKQVPCFCLLTILCLLTIVCLLTIACFGGLVGGLVQPVETSGAQVPRGCSSRGRDGYQAGGSKARSARIAS